MTPEQNDKTMPKRYKSNGYPIHFVTTNVMNNIFLLNHEEYCQIIVDNLKFYRDKYKLKIYAWVVIPWHIHLLLELLEGVRIQDVIRDFKGFCAKQLVERLKVDRRYDLLEKFCIAPTRGLAGTLASVNPPRSPALAGERSGVGIGGSELLVRAGNPPSDRTGALAPVRPPARAGGQPLDMGCPVALAYSSSPARAGELPPDGCPVALAGGQPDGCPVALAAGHSNDIRKQRTKEMNKHRTQPKFQIFEHDSYDFNVYTDKKLDQKINYIEVRNPIKHRLIKTEEELEKFRWSSYRCRYLGDNSVIKIDFAGMLEI